MMNHANFAETTLAAAITTTSETSITVTSEAGFPAVPFIISIGTEAFAVTTVDTVTWTVTRGYEGSTAATHLNGAAIFHDISAAEADAIATKLPLAGGTLTGPLIMDNMDVSLVKLLTLHGEIDDGNSGAADTIDWNAGAAHKSTLTGNSTLAFTGYGADIIPDMTSNTAPSGVASGSNEYNPAYYAMDDNVTTYWKISGDGVPGWVAYQFATAKTIIVYSILGYSSSIYPTAWILKGSNNGTDWTQIDSRTGQNTGTKTYFNVTSPGSYLYYQLYISAGYSDVTEWELIETAIIDPLFPCFLTLKLVQDGTGGRTVTWPATVKGTPNLNPAASSTSIVYLYWDGTNYYVVNPAGTLATLGLDADIASLALPANTTISAAGAELVNDANAAAQLVTLGTAAYSEGTWTPTLNSFTIVGSAPTASGTYKRIGNMVFITCAIEAGSGGNTSVASVGALSFINNLPFNIVGNSNCNISNSNVVSLGIGSLYSSTIMATPTFSAQIVPIIISAVYNA